MKILPCDELEDNQFNLTIECDCGSDYLHPVQVRVTTGRTRLVIDNDSLSGRNEILSKEDPLYHSRGVVIDTLLRCEICKSLVHWRDRFVKGRTFRSRKYLRYTGISLSHDDKFPQFQTIWRD